MSVAAIGDSHSTTTRRAAINVLHASIPRPPMETTYRKAISSIRAHTKNASSSGVHIYSFNIPPEELNAAYALLDKQEGRKSMRLTDSDDYNFVVKYMPGRVHEAAQVYFNMYTGYALAGLRQLPPTTPAGCSFVGTTTFQLGENKKQPDACIVPDQSDYPSIILEVGDSESLGQLKVDARRWIEHMPEVRLVILVSIDRPTAPNENPRITIQLWRGVPPTCPTCTIAARQRVGEKVWESDWTQAATPMYLLLADIFRGQVPASYGANTRVDLDTAAWRREILAGYV